MKYITFIIITFTFSSSLFSQLEKEWEKPITIHNEYQVINSWEILDCNLVFNMRWSEEIDSSIHHQQILYVVDSVGNDVWQFDWSNQFPSNYDIQIFRHDDAKVFFIADHQRNDSTDYYGGLRLFEGIDWAHPEVGEISLPVLQTDGLVFQIKNDTFNRLKLVSEDGNNLWISDTVLERSSNQFLASNGHDKLLWMVNRKLHLLNENGAFIDIDSSQFWSPYYTAFNMHQSVIDFCTWGSLDYKLNRTENNLQFGMEEDLPYANNSFIPATVNLAADSNNNIYVALENINGLGSQIPYLLKYDENLKLLWTHVADTTIYNLHEDSDYLIYLSGKSIVQVDKINGEIVWQETLPEGDYFHKSLVDSKKRVLYVYLKSAEKHKIIKYNIKKTSTSVEPINTFEILCYPNPFTDVLNFPANFPSRAQIVDMKGRIVFNSKIVNNKIELGFLPSGTYHIGITDLNSGQTINQILLKF